MKKFLRLDDFIIGIGIESKRLKNVRDKKMKIESDVFDLDIAMVTFSDVVEAFVVVVVAAVAAVVAVVTDVVVVDVAVVVVAVVVIVHQK